MCELNRVYFGKIWLKRNLSVKLDEKEARIIQKIWGVHNWIRTKFECPVSLWFLVVLLSNYWGKQRFIMMFMFLTMITVIERSNSRLFCKVLSDSHCLNQLLPLPSLASQVYNLRPGGYMHSLSSVKHSNFMKRFIIKSLFSYKYFLRATAYMLLRSYAIAIPSVRPSVCLSITRVDQSETVEVRIMQFSPYSSPIPVEP